MATCNVAICFPSTTKPPLAGQTVCIIHYNVRASYCILESIIQYILKVLGSVFQNDARILAHRVHTQKMIYCFGAPRRPRVGMGGVVEGGKEEGLQEATARFRAPSESQDFPVAERTGGAAGDSAACLGAGVSGGAADPDLDLGGPRRGGEAGAPTRPRPAAAAPRAAAGAGGSRTTVAAAEAFDALLEHPGPRRAAGSGAAAGTSASAAVEPDAGGGGASVAVICSAVR